MKSRWFVHKQWVFAFVAVGLVVGAAAAHAQATADPQGKLLVLRETIRAREATTAPLLYAKCEVEVIGPAVLFPIPREFKGDQYRQVNIQEWWAQDQRIAVVTHAASTCWVDGKVVSSRAERAEPDHKYVFDGEHYYYLDTRPEGRFLQINASWPFHNCAYPPLFGRNLSARSLGEILDAGVEYAGADQVNSHPCSVVRFKEKDAQVSAWLAEDLDALCAKVEVRTPRGLVFDETCQFATNPDGFRRPSEATERQIDARGQARSTTWRVLEFAVNPPAPANLFTPSLDDADIVMDGATGKILKSPKEK